MNSCQADACAQGKKSCPCPNDCLLSEPDEPDGIGLIRWVAASIVALVLFVLWL